MLAKIPGLHGPTWCAMVFLDLGPGTRGGVDPNKVEVVDVTHYPGVRWIGFVEEKVTLEGFEGSPGMKKGDGRKLDHHIT